MPGAQPHVPSIALLISCEHGGNRIPARYRKLFSRSSRLLASHRGYDPGALTLAREFAARFRAPLFYSTVSRLLVDLNRRVGHPQLFSAPVRRLPPSERNELIERLYRPYRDMLEARVATEVAAGKRVVHLSCHSFTPRLGQVKRNADIGLLFDPRRRVEATLCAAWGRALTEADSRLRVRRNYPYRGSADGLTTHLRRRFPEPAYAGIELEVNQRFPLGNAGRWRTLRRVLLETFAQSVMRMHAAPMHAGPDQEQNLRLDKAAPPRRVHASRRNSARL